MILTFVPQSPKRYVSVLSAAAAEWRVKPEMRSVCCILRWRYGRRWQLRPFLSNPFAE
jgi:hypothetical protein